MFIFLSRSRLAGAWSGGIVFRAISITACMPPPMSFTWNMRVP